MEKYKTLFDSKRIASGYANDRPWLHKSVIEQIQTEFADIIPFQNGLDVGCGAGLSTKAEETEIPQTPYDIVTAAGVVDWVDKDKSRVDV